MVNEVIPIRKPIPPKEERFTHKGQTFLCRYDPNGTDASRWVWVLDYVRTYRYFGGAVSLQAAKSQARRRIDRLTTRQTAHDESDDG